MGRGDEEVKIRRRGTGEGEMEVPERCKRRQGADEEEDWHLDDVLGGVDLLEGGDAVGSGLASPGLRPVQDIPGGGYLGSDIWVQIFRI